MASLTCQSWLSLPDILLFVLFLKKKRFQVLIGLGDFFMKKPKRGRQLCEVVYIHYYFKDFYHQKVEQLYAVQWCKEKGLSVGYCEGL